MSDWIGIKKSINSTLGTPDDKPLNELLDSDIAELNKSLSTLLKSGNIPIVKSVQRGVVGKISKGNSGSSTTSFTVTLNLINIEKVIVIIEGFPLMVPSSTSSSSNSNHSSSYGNTYISSLTSNSVTFYREYVEKEASDYGSDRTYLAPAFSWQVIEFY